MTAREIHEDELIALRDAARRMRLPYAPLLRASQNGELAAEERDGWLVTTLREVRRYFYSCQVIPAAPQVRAVRPCVYVIGFGPYIKIGFTTNPVEARMAGLFGHYPDPPKVYAVLKNRKITHERELHARFASLRVKGEWFRHEGELADWISGGCK
jgi:hypothetical protein